MFIVTAQCSIWIYTELSFIVIMECSAMNPDMKYSQDRHTTQLVKIKDLMVQYYKTKNAVGIHTNTGSEESGWWYTYL